MRISDWSSDVCSSDLPTLLVRSGEQASFLAGGEFPVPVPQVSGSGNTLSIQYKEFGVRLSVTPFVLSKEHIVLKIAPEVSELDYNNGVQLQGYVVPGLRSEEHTSELQSLMRISYAVFCLNN